MNEITKRTIEEYKNYLVEEEKSSVTIEKYIRRMVRRQRNYQNTCT